MADVIDIGREPFIYVEIDQDFCLETYGVAPCLAAVGLTGPDKCLNTLITCQYVEAYDKGTLILRFCKAASNLPRDQVYFPSLISVTTVPTELNIGGGDENSNPLGRRAGVTLELIDHPYHDRVVDKYWNERIYNPMERGSFWSKWTARNPYYFGRNLRVVSGYIGQSPASYIIQHYVIDKIVGPANGKVTIIAKDPIKLTDSDRAQAPTVTPGSLVENLTDISTIFSITPASIASFYNSSGIAKIDSELFSFTRIGVNFTFVSRGLRGTEIAEHTSGSAVQEVLVIDDMRVDDVISMLLLDYTSIDASFFDFPSWQLEADRWLSGFRLSTWIADPVGVGTLLAEIMNQCQCYIWWDEKLQSIQFKALRPLIDALGDTAYQINSNDHILEGSFHSEDKPNERVSQVWIYYGMRNPLNSLDEPSNFSRLLVEKDTAAESEDQFNERRIHKVYSRWFDESNTGEVLTSARRRIERYRFNPTVITYKVDAKDGDLLPSDVVDISHPDLVGFYGEPIARRMQIVSYEDNIRGHQVTYKTRPYGFTGGRYAFIMPNGSNIYSNATPSELLLAGYIAPNTGVFADGTLAYRAI